MLLIPCPCCGVAGAETEFRAGGEAHLRRADPDAPDEAFAAYLFERRNPRGPHLERWHHAFGCGKWFVLARDTATMAILGAYPADLPVPPAAVAARLAGG